jgi:hypothetical protein
MEAYGDPTGLLTQLAQLNAFAPILARPLGQTALDGKVAKSL